VSRTPHRLHNPTQDSILKMAQRLSLLLSFRILYTAVSFGPTLGSDVSAEDIGVSRGQCRQARGILAECHFVRPTSSSQGISPYHELSSTTRGWRGCSLLPFGCAAYALRTPLEIRHAKAKGEHPPLRGEPAIWL
jgi:hypothetical protein